MCHRTGKYTVCRRARASFSPEVLHAGTVKGLIRLLIMTDFILFIFKFKIAVHKEYRQQQAVINNNNNNNNEHLSCGHQRHERSRDTY